MFGNSFFGAPYFGDPYFGGGSSSQPVAAAAAAVGGGVPARHARRRRYIMPDGTMLEATTDEAIEWLRLYSRPKPGPTAAPPRAAAAIRMPPIVLEKRDVRFIPATDSAPDTWQAVISERFSFQVPPEIHRQAEIRANRIRADEEALTALLM